MELCSLVLLLFALFGLWGLGPSLCFFLLSAHILIEPRFAFYKRLCKYKQTSMI